jgi:lipoate---protein ligase
MEILPYTFDDSLIEQARSDNSPHVKIYNPDFVSVVLGHGSDPEAELYIDSCIKDSIPIYRRSGGGCAVVLDPGNAIVSAVLPASGYGRIKEYLDRFTNWTISGLLESGVKNVYRDGICDLVIDNRKIAGASMQRKKDYVYYSTSILIMPELEYMERYLKYPPRVPSYRRLRAHRDFVAPLRDYINLANIKHFMEELQNNLNVQTL